MGAPEALIREAAVALKKARKAFALTGAGASVESGIPDFRSDVGLWTKYPPEEFATIDAFLADPLKVWGMWRELGAQLSDARPNPGHVALAELEAAGHLAGIVTQNIDNLHQAGGSKKVIEYHGNGRRMYCMKCHRRSPLDLAALGALDVAPRCACKGLQKPDVVLFGELIPRHAQLEAETLAQTADVVLIVGTSAQVYPAAGLPYTAHERGALIIECNTEPTDFTHTITTHFLQGPCAQTLPKLRAALAATVKSPIDGPSQKRD